MCKILTPQMKIRKCLLSQLNQKLLHQQTEKQQSHFSPFPKRNGSHRARCATPNTHPEGLTEDSHGSRLEHEALLPAPGLHQHAEGRRVQLVVHPEPLAESHGASGSPATQERWGQWCHLWYTRTLCWKPRAALEHRTVSVKPPAKLVWPMAFARDLTCSTKTNNPLLPHSTLWDFQKNHRDYLKMA